MSAASSLLRSVDDLNYLSFHNYGRGERGSATLVSFTIVQCSSIFHFHDYGRKAPKGKMP